MNERNSVISEHLHKIFGLSSNTRAAEAAEADLSKISSLVYTPSNEVDEVYRQSKAAMFGTMYGADRSKLK